MICQKRAQFELRQAPVSVFNIFSKWDKHTVVVIINDYKTIKPCEQISRFLFYHVFYSIASFHLKKQGTILLKIEYLKKEYK